MQKTIEDIEKKLRAAFRPSFLEIVDETHLHSGHFQQKNLQSLPNKERPALTHLRLKIHAKKFAPLTLVERHRAIYAVLEEDFKEGLHALTLEEVQG